jgi:hypothetical protein
MVIRLSVHTVCCPSPEEDVWHALAVAPLHSTVAPLRAVARVALARGCEALYSYVETEGATPHSRDEPP